MVRGHLEAWGADHVVIGIGGVSLRVHVPASALASLGSVGGEVSLHTHLYVREDHLALFGFPSAEELSLFELLLTVSGIGPRAALSLLSALPPESLRAAISSDNTDMLTKVPGIGRKTAARIILDLKGKVKPPVSEPSQGPLGVDSEVMAALAGLGYSAAEAQMAVASVQPGTELSLEDRILLALRFFAQRS